MRALDERTFVAGQIAAADVAGIAAAGVTLVVNNRPDGEEPGQPSGAEIEAAARAAGLDYRFIPVAGGFPSESVEALAQALGDAEGKALLFCRSGSRSTFLWALARSSRGTGGDELLARAAAAGYDLAPLRPWLGMGTGPS